MQLKLNEIFFLGGMSKFQYQPTPSLITLPHPFISQMWF